ncbi:unnamed protein product [Strongylus vulgaris]|uniref:DNA repair protein RAD51 homolog 3 n=1 Tax=Strongylus vulgaris TaxID=40348 RepID=A0A3P7LN82_STRVU|nr:unnamed protein product [Strongylus vulgaris]
MTESVQFKTARELYSFEYTKSLPLTTGSPPLDDLIGGGFFPGCVTEISGEAGCGKSQICMQFAAVTIASGRNVMCIETERGFSVKRVREVSFSIVCRRLSELSFFGMASRFCL